MATEVGSTGKPPSTDVSQEDTPVRPETEEDLAFWFWNTEVQEREDPETRRMKFLQCAGFVDNESSNMALNDETIENLDPNEEETWSLSSESSSRNLSPLNEESEYEVDDFLDELHAYDSEISESERFNKRSNRRLAKQQSRVGKFPKVGTGTWDSISKSEEHDEWRTISEFDEPFPQFITRLYKSGNIDIASEKIKDDDYYDRLSSDSETEYIRGSDKAENSSGWYRLSLLPDPWSEVRYPTPQFISREELANEYVSPYLNMTMIASGLGNLTLPPGHSEYTCTKLQLQGLGIESIEMLSSYKYLQYIDIGMNSISNLSPVWNVKHLIVLDASNNLVSEHTFGHPDKILFLTYLNLSNNKFTRIPYLKQLWSLKHLNLSQNKIKVIENLESLVYLEYLDISSNELESITNLKNPNLVEVNFSRNQLKQWDRPAPHFFKHLEIVNVAHNSFQTLKTFRDMYSLKILNASKNEFTAMSDFEWLRTLPKLEDLRIYGNELMKIIQDARRLIIYYVPSLKKLDGGTVTSMERVSCHSLYSKLPYGNVINDDTLHFYHSRSRNPEDGWEQWKPAGQHPALILLVSYIGTNCHEIAWKVFQKNPYKVKIARIVTTMPKFNKKSNGDFLPNLHYMKHLSAKEFYEKEENEDFVATYLQLGYNFGLESTQLEVRDRVLIAVVNMSCALKLSWRGFCSHNILVCAENLDILNSRLYSWFKKTNFYKNDSHTQLVRKKVRKNKRNKRRQKPSWRDQINIPYRSISGAGINAISGTKDRRLSRSKKYTRSRGKRLHRAITSVKSKPSKSHLKEKKIYKLYNYNSTDGCGSHPITRKQERSNYFWDPILERNTENIFKPGLSKPISKEWCHSHGLFGKKKVEFVQRRPSVTKSVPSVSHSVCSSDTTKYTMLSSHALLTSVNEEEDFIRFLRNIHRKRLMYRQMNRDKPGFFQLYIPSDDLEEAANILNEFVEEKYEKLQSKRDTEILFSDSPHFDELVMSHINEYVDEIRKSHVLPDML